MEKKLNDALLSRARVVSHTEHVAGVYRRDGSRCIAEVLCGVARQIGMMKPEYQKPLTMDELEDLRAAEGEGAKVWIEDRSTEAFAKELVVVLMASCRSKKYGKDMRAWLALPSEEEMKMARWDG